MAEDLEPVPDDSHILVMPDNSLTRINGVTLTEMGLAQAGPISVGAAPPQNSLVYVPGSDGSFDATLRNRLKAAYFDRRQVTVPVVASGTRAEVIAAKTAIGVYAGTQVDLYDARNGGFWRGPMSISAWTDLQESWDRRFVSTATLTVDAEPGLILPTERINLVYNQYYMIRGNMVVWPTFTMTPSSSPTKVGVAASALLDGAWTYIGSIENHTPTQASGDVTMDCRMSLVSVGTLRLPISITMDPPYLIPGYMRFVFTGASRCILRYEPRVML